MAPGADDRPSRTSTFCDLDRRRRERRMSSQPMTHVWSRRIGLILIGLLAGLAVPAMWIGEAVAFAIVLGIAGVVVGVFTYRLPTEPADPKPTVTTRKIKPVQAALAEADLMLQQAQQTVREIIADA